jgi:rare lipoprotein A
MRAFADRSARWWRAALVAALAVFASGLAFHGCGGAASAAPARENGATQRGKAAWYGSRFHGRKTASGEKFNKNALTAAHRKLPFGTVVRVTNLRNQRTVTVRINDRGPYGKGRIIDVSEAAARKLRMINSGVVPVVIEVVKLPPAKPGKPRKRRKSRR